MAILRTDLVPANGALALNVYTSFADPYTPIARQATLEQVLEEQQGLLARLEEERVGVEALRRELAMAKEMRSGQLSEVSGWGCGRGVSCRCSSLPGVMMTEVRSDWECMGSDE
jgi:hypothetical protein